MWMKSLLSVSLVLFSVVNLPSPAMAQVSMSLPEKNAELLHDLYLHYSNEFGLTGCSPLGNSMALICLGWVGNTLTTCLQWGNITAIATCINREYHRSNQNSFLVEFYQGVDVLPMPFHADWGYRFNLTIY